MNLQTVVAFLTDFAHDHYIYKDNAISPIL